MNIDRKNYPEIGYTPVNLRHFMIVNFLQRKDVAKILKVKPKRVKRWLQYVGEREHRPMPPEKWYKLLHWQLLNTRQVSVFLEKNEQAA